MRGEDPRAVLGALVAAWGRSPGLDGLPPSEPDPDEMRAIVRLLRGASPAALGVRALELAEEWAGGEKPNPAGAMAALKFAHDMELEVRRRMGA